MPGMTANAAKLEQQEPPIFGLGQPAETRPTKKSTRLIYPGTQISVATLTIPREENRLGHVVLQASRGPRPATAGPGVEQQRERQQTRRSRLPRRPRCKAVSGQMQDSLGPAGR